MSSDPTVAIDVEVGDEGVSINVSKETKVPDGESLADVTSSAKAVKATKAAKAKSAPLHPPYEEMIEDAIVSLKERTGSSQYAIAKFIEEKQKKLPTNFKKLLLFNLKKLVSEGKIVKVKSSFKLPPVRSAAAKAPPAKASRTASRTVKSPAKKAVAKKGKK